MDRRYEDEVQDLGREDEPSVSEDPFPKGRAGLRPYRAPYYVAALLALGIAFPYVKGYLDPLVGDAARQLNLAVPADRQVEKGASGASNAQQQAGNAVVDPGAATRDGGTREVAQAPTSSSATARSHVELPSSALKFVVGDLLKLVFYERIESEEDRWRTSMDGAHRAPASFQMRVEFSGDFPVLQDGLLTVPVLGSFEAAGRNGGALQADLAKAFERFTGRAGLVSITIVERPPVYIVGPLKNPGAYKHVPGMTVLHVMALAGGLNVDQQMNWQLVDSAREVDKRETTLERAKRLLAKKAVLIGERDGKSPVVPKKLLELATEVEARSLIESEKKFRNLAVTGYQSRKKAGEAAVELAKSEIASLEQRLKPLDESLALREERMRSFDRLIDKGLSSSGPRQQAQAEFLDLQSRRQDVVSAIAQGKQRQAIAQQELESNLLTYRSELQNELATVDVDLPVALKGLEASDAILGVMQKRALGRDTGETSLGYRILRQGQGGPKFIDADLTTRVELGDVVHVLPGAAAGRAVPAGRSNG